MKDVELSDADLDGITAGLGKNPPAVAKDPPREFPRFRPFQTLASGTRRATGPGGGCSGGTCPA